MERGSYPHVALFMPFQMRPWLGQASIVPLMRKSLYLFVRSKIVDEIVFTMVLLWNSITSKIADIGLKKTLWNLINNHSTAQN